MPLVLLRSRRNTPNPRWLPCDTRAVAAEPSAADDGHVGIMAGEIDPADVRPLGSFAPAAWVYVEGDDDDVVDLGDAGAQQGRCWWLARVVEPQEQRMSRKTNKTFAEKHEVTPVITTAPLGPWRQITRPAGDWVIVADEMIEADQARRWDVYALHRGGARIPAGPNMHQDPTPEIVRLETLIRWPST